MTSTTAPTSATAPTTAAPTTAAAPARPSRRARPAVVAVRVVRLLLSVQFLVGGVLKLTADPAMVTMFDQVGGPAIRLLVGACELAAAAGLLVPRLARLAAAGLVALMGGAAVTNVVVLGTSPVLPLVLLVLAAVAASVRTRTGGGR